MVSATAKDNARKSHSGTVESASWPRHYQTQLVIKPVLAAQFAPQRSHCQQGGTEQR
jgi:hypothetical protein